MIDFMSQNFSNEKFLSLWKRANNAQKRKIFYYSLFDFKSFEEEARIELCNEIKNIQNNLINLIKEIDKNFFSKTKKAKFVQHAGNDGLLKSILLFELKKRGVKVKSCGDNFPDLMIEDSIHLEIKRQVSTKNMGDDFWGVDKKECEKLILLIFFPIFDADNIERIEDLTNGYYFIKNSLGCKRCTDVLICYPTKENFEETLERIIKCLNNPNWCKNE